MKTESWRIHGAFGLIGEVFVELFHAEKAFNACGLGESKRETIDEVIRTYRECVEQMDKKLSDLNSGLNS